MFLVKIFDTNPADNNAPTQAEKDAARVYCVFESEEPNIYDLVRVIAKKQSKAIIAIRVNYLGDVIETYAPRPT